MTDKAEKKPSYFFAIPAYDFKLYVPCVQSLLLAMKILLEGGHESQMAFEVGMPYVSMARNNLISKFMLTDFTDLIFVDADLGVPVDAFKALMDSPEEVVAGVYPKKQHEEVYPVLVQTDEQKHPINENGLLLAEGLPTGFMKIKRSALMKLSGAYPELAYIDQLTGRVTYNFFGTYVDKGRWYGDDYGFCKLWRDIGGKCFILPNITFLHCGQRNYEGNFWNYMQRKSKEAQK